MATRTPHLDRELLGQLALGIAEPELVEEFTEHVASCGQCSQELRELQVVSTLVRSLPTEEAPRDYGFPSRRFVAFRILKNLSREAWSLRKIVMWMTWFLALAVAVVALVTRSDSSQSPSTGPLEISASSFDLSISALDDLNRAIDIDPNNPEARLERGRFRLESGSILKAIDDLSIAIAQRPNDAEAYFLRGRAYALAALIADSEQSGPKLALLRLDDGNQLVGPLLAILTVGDRLALVGSQGLNFEITVSDGESEGQEAVIVEVELAVFLAQKLGTATLRITEVTSETSHEITVLVSN